MSTVTLNAIAFVCGLGMVALAWRVDADLHRPPPPPEPTYHRWLAHDRAPTPGERT